MSKTRVHDIELMGRAVKVRVFHAHAASLNEDLQAAGYNTVLRQPEDPDSKIVPLLVECPTDAVMAKVQEFIKTHPEIDYLGE